MNIRRLAWKNLLRRKSKAVFTGLGIFLGIGTFVAITAITAGMEGAVREKLDRFGANILVSPRTEELSLGFGDISLGGTQVTHAGLSMKDGDVIRSIPERERLRMVVPYLLAALDASGRNLVWMGVPRGEVGTAKPWWKIQGAPLSGPGEVLLGAEAAAALDKGPGGTLESAGTTFRIAGVLHPTGEKEDGMVIADLGDVQALAKNPGGVTWFEVAALCKDCPVDMIVAQIGEKLPGAKIAAIRQVVESRQAAVEQFRRLGLSVSGVVLVIGGLMVLVTVMGSVQERTREIGVLRAVGFRQRAILSLLFWETGWVASFSSVAGAALGSAVAIAAGPLFGTTVGNVSPGPALLGVGLGLALGLLGAIPPARKAAALSPTEAIRSL